MLRPPTTIFQSLVLPVSFGIWALLGGTGFAQTPAEGEPQIPPISQENTIPTEDQGEVTERGIIRDHRGHQKLLPPRERRLPTPETSSPIIRNHAIQPDIPSLSQTPTLQITPKVTSPSIVAPATGTVVPADRYTASTDNLTMVANALRLRHKSLTTLVTAAPNLPVTQPVEISIGYYSPAGNQRITQSYVRSTGNRFLYNDREGDGNPRMLRVVITLSERKPGGGVETFPLSWQANLDPLYDVAIGPFAFDLLSDCDAVGKSEILFRWKSPDGGGHDHTFSMRPGSRKTIERFAWSRSEVSWSHKLTRQNFGFSDEDHGFTNFLWDCIPNLACGFSNTPGGQDHLLTSPSKLVKGNLSAKNDSCSAYFEYQITKTLRWYPRL